MTSRSVALTPQPLGRPLPPLVLWALHPSLLTVSQGFTSPWASLMESQPREGTLGGEFRKLGPAPLDPSLCQRGNAQGGQAACARTQDELCAW